MDKFRDLINKANEEIEKVKEWYYENVEAFDYMDLKLHNLSYYCYSQAKYDFPLCYADANNNGVSYFDMFCEDEYRNMQESLMDAHKIDFMSYHYQLGRTSSFYLHDRSIFEAESYIYWQYTLHNLMEKFYGDYYTTFDNNGNIDIEETFEDINESIIISEEIERELEYISTELFDDTTKDFEDMLLVYSYIKDFKDNQISIFKKWIEFYEEELQIEADNEKKYAEERSEICNSFIDEKLRTILVNSNITNENIKYIKGVMI